MLHAVERNFCMQVSAEDFVTSLLIEGKTIPCDDASPCDDSIFPKCFDQEKILRGQKFYQKNFTSMFLSMMLGLISMFSNDDIRRILRFTNNSSTAKTAYKRYAMTIMHVNLWHTGDFKPGSKVWTSLLNIRKLHSLKSADHCRCGGHRISQKDMAITQLAFIGFIVTRTTMIGIHNAEKKDLEGFIRLWRVIGQLLGMNDKYNICRESLEETKDICEMLFKTMLKQNMEGMNADFLEMADAMVNAMKIMTITIRSYVVFLQYAFLLVNTKPENCDKISFAVEGSPLHLNPLQKIQYFLIKLLVYMLQFKILRLFHNAMCYLNICWIPQNFPLVATVCFGRENARLKKTY